MSKTSIHCFLLSIPSSFIRQVRHVYFSTKGGDVIDFMLNHMSNFICKYRYDNYILLKHFTSHLTLLLLNTMELSERLIQVKSTAEHEKDFLPIHRMM